ncbi:MULTISPECIES: phytoene desaturase family protein [Actinoalloteichus]|uniref:Phytoene dehydrogenase-like oxidoreductase n=1 Tax=Actinoalloteichus fjordicus TaxID=1612552 RepID=A0AAC9LE09_9PSEU|nr:MULTISPECIES: NAD(P)/FAD-dependent oxidoreductase [Actinoalloteichus]APU15626.1 phytoene dehydrogenase-like oxidoreductase [Actinoalloteichus fjordicus]APU21686.1 phytoene dehydrogenase-like oxidoreductase [Actinoalloteichus sp. GBA129-24]
MARTTTPTRPRKTMIIIGAGLGGLSTGCYAQMNGYESRIFEMHEFPGGCCTSWDRGNFTFDCCISWLLGNGPGNEMHQIWLELGALQGKEMRHFDVFNIVRGRDGQAVYFYSDPDRLQAHLTDISPEDARHIRDFCDGLRKFKKALAVYPFLKPVGLMKTTERWRMLSRYLPYFNVVRKSISVLMSDYSAKFRHPLLREAFNFILYERHPAFPVLPNYFQLASHANLSAGVPEGGSMGLARSIEERYQRLGGEVTYNAKVEEVIVEDDTAVGVRLSDGREVRADIVVSAADGHTTTMKFLQGRYLNDEYRKLYTQTIEEPGMVFPGYFILFLGLRRPFPEGEPCTTYLLTEDEAADMIGIRHSSMNVQFRSMHYPELSPEATTVVYATYFCDIAPWRELNDGPEQASRIRKGEELHTLPVRHGRDYHQAKRQVRNAILSFLEKRFPGLTDAVAVRDMSSPLTQVRYTGNYDGTVLGWQPFVESGETLEVLVRKYGPGLPGLKNFYFSGVWATTGGLIRAAAAGRHVMQFVCRDDGREFTASIDETKPLPTHVVIPVGPSRRPAAEPAPEPVAAGSRSAERGAQ